MAEAVFVRHVGCWVQSLLCNSLPDFTILFFLVFWMELLSIYKPQGPLAGTNPLGDELSESSHLLIILKKAKTGQT